VRPATVRRLVVFGVCALGVTALYLAPSVARSPGQLRSDGRTSVQPAPPATRPATFSPDRAERPAHPASPTTVAQAGPTGSVGPEPGAPPPQRRLTRSATGATAYDPGQAPDTEPPSAVASISFTDVGPDRLTVHWAPATDDVGVVGYRIWLNGFQVAQTTALRATVAWFNDGSRQQVVQVRALDAAGHESVEAPTTLVNRPAPGASPTPEPVATPTPPAPAGTPEPAATGTGRVPSPTPSGSAGAPDGDG
jgi:hypothetical protein